MKAAIAILLMLSLPLINGCERLNSPAVPVPSEDTPASELPSKQLSTFQQIQGTPYLMAPINRSDDRGSSFSSYDSGYSVHNVAFLDTTTLASHRLLENNEALIVGTTEYGNLVEGTTVTQWLVHLIIAADTNDDGVLDYRDHKTLATTDAAGQGYTEVITGIDSTFGMVMVEPGVLTVTYEQAGDKLASTIDLNGQTITATQPLIDLGAEVQ
jgi:hypothetical protein